MSERTCDHQDEIKDVPPLSKGCKQCIDAGDTWVHLRLCRTCGWVACCDESKNKHAKEHFYATGHSIVRSLEPGETWSWCYADEVFF